MGRINKKFSKFLELEQNTVVVFLFVNKLGNIIVINYILYNKNKAPLKKSTKLGKNFGKIIKLYRKTLKKVI